MTLSPALRKCGWWLAAVAAVAAGIVLWIWLGPGAQLASLRAAVAGTVAADGLGMAAGLVAVAGLGAGLAGRPAPDFAQAPLQAPAVCAGDTSAAPPDDGPLGPAPSIHAATTSLVAVVANLRGEPDFATTSEAVASRDSSPARPRGPPADC